MIIRLLDRLGHSSLLRLILIVTAISILSQLTTQSTAAISEPTALPSQDVGASHVLAQISTADLSAFHLLSADEGWIVLDQQLNWTRNAGQTWSNITPPGYSTIRPSDHPTVLTTFFLDPHRGWFVSTDNSGIFTISRTTDTGATWQTRSLALFSSGEPDATTAAVHLYFLDAQTGWLVTRRATSNNFNVGALFKTSDGGDTWVRLTIPSGDPVYFASADLGWAVGGAAHNQLFATRDGGKSWQLSHLPCPSPPALPCSPLLPKFSNARDGVLPVIVAAGSASRLDLYQTRNGGVSWELGSQLPLGNEIAPGTRFPISILNAEQSITILPQARGVANRAPSGVTSITPSRDPLIGGIRELDMATPRVGWAKHVEGICTNGDKTRCTQSTRLLRTADGGQTWEPVDLPAIPPSASVLPSATAPRSVAGPTAFTVTVTGQGFDACGLPSLSQFQTWWANSPYMAYNLYIGGSALAACSPLSASFVSQLAAQGWKFFPTWVGPQAPCAGYASSISYDTNTAYNQGIAQADLALDAAYNLGLTDAGKTGTIIYYDLEAYNTNDSTCRTAAHYFIGGWSAQLKATGNVAGAYGAACGSAVSDWADAPDPQYVPDILWLAWWQSPYQYRADATVWGAPCLSDSLWVNHQRLRQYAGGHNETWAGVTLNIDSDVLDGVVASLSNVSKPTIRYYFPFVRR